MADDALARSLAARRRERVERNPLRKWVSENFVALEKAHYQDGLTYREMAETAAQLGIKNINGDAPHWHVVRKWFIAERVARGKGKR